MEDIGIQKRTNILRVEPDGELCFKGDFKDIVTTQMKLINPSEEKVCFKVKTTAPRRYCVRPNNGILGPKSSVDVLLRLQPLDKPDNENTKHKFMVQSLSASNVELASLEKLWRNATTDRLMYVKLKCAFETRDGTRLTTDDINNITVAGLPHSQQLLRKVSADSTASSTSINSREMKLYYMPFDSDARNGPGSEDALKIRQDVEKLRLENKKLKESERQLRKLTAKSESGGVQSKMEIENRGREMVYPSIVYIIVALVIGLIVGKFIL